MSSASRRFCVFFSSSFAGLTRPLFDASFVDASSNLSFSPSGLGTRSFSIISTRLLERSCPSRLLARLSESGSTTSRRRFSRRGCFLLVSLSRGQSSVPSTRRSKLTVADACLLLFQPCLRLCPLGRLQRARFLEKSPNNLLIRCSRISLQR